MRAFLVVVFIVVSLIVNSQPVSNLNCRFEKYFLAGDMANWAILVDSLQTANLTKPDDDVLLLAEYGLIGYLLSQNQKAKAEFTVEKFESHIQKSLKRYPNNANYHAYAAALYGFKIGLSPWKAPFLNSGHQQKLEKALSLQTVEAMPFIEQANSLYFRPFLVGGDKEKAKGYYEKAFAILDRETNCNWVYFNIGSWLGQVYSHLGYTDKALKLYRKLLKKAPDFQYVKNELLPQLEKGNYIDIGKQIENELLKE